MKRILFIILVLSVSIVQAQNLDDYLKMAADSNAAIKAQFMEYQAALEQVPQVGALPDPEVSFGYFISPVETRVGAQEARFSAMQMFPWFGTLGAKQDAKTEMAKAKYAAFEQALNDLRYRVTEKYYLLYELDQHIRITGGHLQILRTFESLATQKFESGKAGMVDILRIQMEIAELENRLAFLKEKNMPMIASFNQLLNRRSTAEVLIPGSLAPLEIGMELAVLSDSVQAGNDQLSSLAHMQLAMQHNGTTARKMGAPSFGLGMSYVVVGERTDMVVAENGKDAFMPMLSVKLPIYRGKYRAQLKETKLALNALESREEELRNMLQTQLDMAWTEYLDAGRRMNLYAGQVGKAKQAQNILIESYSSDGKDFEEILRVQRMLLKYEMETIKAVTDRNKAVAKLQSFY